ncbi:MAG: hypothetical protein OEU09_09620, partial [Rhodospirillales bacterium]|nr:hypothetical protein [Rhodospirillales bacterium]
MNLETFPKEVWWKLAARARQAQQNGESVRRAVRSHFYNDIYSKWSKGKVSYSPNVAHEMDVGWSTMVGEWTKIQKSKESLGQQLKDDSVGKASVQGRNGPVSKARLWEKYNERPRGDRFQFVVSMGGGMVLFNRMRRACQQYIIEKLASKPDQFVIRGWKVFGEEGGWGRSDSCCVYTAVNYTDPELVKVVEGYIWPQVKDLVDQNFVPLGFFKVAGKPLWAMRMPDSNKAMSVLKVNKATGSAGG